MPALYLLGFTLIFSLALGDGDDAVESLFYSRRIGRAPQGWADPLGGYADGDDQTTILGAWKLSGKTAGGWSIGLLNAVTAEETARIAPAAGPETEQIIEPFNMPARLVKLVLVNGVYVPPEERAKRTLAEGDVLAIWPPVAGG